MRQRRRGEVSQDIAIANATEGSYGGRGYARPRMVWDERVARTNLSDPTADAVASSRITPDDRRAIVRHAMAHRALNALTEREYEVVTRHYGFHYGIPMALTDVAGDLGMSYNAVQKTHGRALRAMRKVLGVKRKSIKREW